MELEPLQKPHPPIWYGVHAPDSAAAGGAQGLAGGQPRSAGRDLRRFDSFRAAWRDARGATRRCRSWGSGVSSWWPIPMLRRSPWRGAPIRDGTRASPICAASISGINAHPRPPTFDGLAGSRSGHRRLARKRWWTHCAEQIGGTGSNYLVGQFVFGDLSLAEALRSIELFAQASHAAIGRPDAG